MKYLIFFLFFSLYSVSSFCFQTICMEGSGVRAFAYIGALQELEKAKKLEDLQIIYGTSGGSIIGALYAAGYSPAEMENYTQQFKMSWITGNTWQRLTGVFSANKNLGFFKANEFEKWMDKMFYLKTNIEHITFRQLKEITHIDLHIICTDIANQAIVDFGDKEYENFSVATAVRASMAVPIMVRPVLLDSKNNKTSKAKATKILVDGGLLYNNPFPIVKDKSNLERILTMTISPSKFLEEPVAPENIKGVMKKIYYTNIDMKPMLENPKHVITIWDGGVSPQIKKISKKTLSTLIEQGRQGSKNYLLEAN
jgi:NTE family protein